METATTGTRTPIAFGPIPSRRLGKSLGVNNIPPKSCSYGCVYCQVGPTIGYSIEPRAFYPPAAVVAEVRRHVARVRARGLSIDHLTFAPDGEPTLDEGLGSEIDGLHRLGIPIAVLSNGSLLWRPEVRARLRRADWVSIKVDAADEATWRAVDRPHHSLELDRVLAGVMAFAAEFTATLVGETMLVAGVNDEPDSLERVGRVYEAAGISTVYLLVPTRPPACGWVEVPDEETIVRAHQILSTHVPVVECVTGREPDEFASTGDLSDDLLRITAVHPMRTSAVRALVDADGAEWRLVDRLVESGDLRVVDYRGERFFIRRVGGPGGATPADG